MDLKKIKIILSCKWSTIFWVFIEKKIKHDLPGKFDCHVYFCNVHNEKGKILHE